MRANMGSPASDAQLDDFRAADRAWLAFPVEDQKLMLVLPGLPEGVVVGIEGRAPQFYGAAQDVVRSSPDFQYLIWRKGIGLADGMDARGEQNFVHVDVAQPRNHRLIQEKPLDIRLAGQGFRQVCLSEILRKRFGAEARDQGVPIHGPRLVKVKVPEPELGERERHTSLELKHC